MIGFERNYNSGDNIGDDTLLFRGELDEKQTRRLGEIRRYQNFYDGYHWEDMAQGEGPEITVNLCKAFVRKFVTFELGKAFAFSTHKSVDDIPVSEDGRTLFEYLEDVWEDNSQYAFCDEMGTQKSITGEAWVQVRYFAPDDPELYDPFEEHPDGRIKIMLMPTAAVFPEFDPHQVGVLRKLSVMYSYKKAVKSLILKKTQFEDAVYKQVWTNDQCVVYDGKDEPQVYPNPYGVIPFVQIKNIAEPSKNIGQSDLDDIIPLNVELNLKKSNVSEIIDYHSAPITIVYGAKVGSLEKGANKIWGGLPKDSRIENLQVTGDSIMSSSYISSTKEEMCQVAGLPLGALGGDLAISNTSGVALSIANAPLVDKTKQKKLSTEDGLERLNKLIIHVAIAEGIITKPDDISNRDFYHTEVTIPDNMPKDTLIELQQIQTEMTLKLESREGALKRLGRENIPDILAKVDKEAEEHPEIYGDAPAPEEQPQLNSGFMNGSTPIEEVRKEITGSNGMTS